MMYNANEGKSPMTLPAITYDQAVGIHGLPFAREEVAWFRHNKLPIFGVPINWFDKDDARKFALETLRAVAMRDTPSMMAVVDFAKQGWDLAQDVLKNILLDFDNYDVEPPNYLKVYRMDLIDGRVQQRQGKSRSDDFFRDIAVVVTIRKVCEKFGVKPTRYDGSPRQSGCSIVSAALRAEGITLQESAVVTIWGRYKRYF